MSDLAERLKITRSRLTHAVTRLETAGHVAAVRRAVFDVLSPDQVRQLVEIAESVVEVLQQDNSTDDPVALPWRRR